MIKVLIVDDSSFMRVKIRGCLEKDPDIKVVGIARNGIEAIQKAIDLKPDVITMDINMPKMSGTEAVAQIMKKCQIPIIVISSLAKHSVRETIEALNRGAIDYINKDELSSEILIEKIHLTKDVVLQTKIRKALDNRPIKVLKNNFSAVAIGISTGGPKALSKLIPHIQADINASILIAQHMPPVFTQSLAERLDGESKIRVKEAEDKESLKPGHAYICPGGMHMLVEDKDVISLYPKEDFSKYHFCPSADLLMASISNTYGSSSLCIVMTGMGADGLEGAKIAKRNKSYIIAQSESSSTIYGMPKAIVSNELQDEILHLDDMANRINELCKKRTNL